ncbi:MAG: hypothetical protein IJR01_01475 [Bacteroidales bacterium]|nr:hypothetical protein [Bacteroidales bacterium]
MKRSILITLLLMLIALISTFAQKPCITEIFDINGLKIGSAVTDSIIKSKLGAPSRVEIGSIPGYLVYYYGESSIGVENGEVIAISVRDSKFPVMTFIFEGGIRVGDNAEEVKAKILQNTRSIITETSRGFKAGNYDDNVHFRVSNGEITEISYDNFDI